MFAALLISNLVPGPRSQAMIWIANCSLVAVTAAFLVGLLRSRLARAGLADLLLALGRLRGADLQAALRRALGDPDLVVARPAAVGHVDLAGAPVAVVEATDGRAVASVPGHDGPAALLVYDASLDDDPDLVAAASAATGMALEQERLEAESSARLADLQASRARLVAAGDAERRRLERDLHDGAQQRLVALGMHLYHGTWSTFQTLGINRSRWDKSIRGLALTLALVIPIGYAVVPVLVLFKVVD